MKTVCLGYLRANGHKEYFVNNANVFDRFICADFTYCDIDESFDRNGNIVGSYRTNFVTKRETRILNDEYLVDVIQINYDFYFIHSPRVVTIDEVNRMSIALNNSGLGVFGCEDKITYGFSEWEKMNVRPYEICDVGYSRSIVRRSIKSFIDLDYIEYKKRYDLFKKQLKGFEHSEFLEHSLKMIFWQNIKFAEEFYNIESDKILNGSFDKKSKLIERLQKKINYKQKKQTR